MKTKETEFDAWWAHTGIGVHTENARHIWNVGWCAARIGQWEEVQADTNAELRQKLLAMAVECFKAHDHERARFYQDLADEKHSIWNL